MKTKRQFGWILVALIVLALGTVNLLAQSGENSGIPTNIGSPGNPGDQGAPPNNGYPGNPGDQGVPPNNGYPGNPGDQGVPQNAGNPSNDPPARVARIQYIAGEVSLQPGGVNDWVAANLNRPLTTSDRVWTDKNSKAELNVGTGFLRMDSESSLTLTNVSNGTVQAELDQGVLELTVLHLEPGEIFEVDTPNTAFTVMKPGVYVFTVRPNDNETWITVRKGNGQATGNGPAVKVSSGEQARFTGQNLAAQTYAAPAPDGFEEWAQVRDKRLDGSQSARYVAPGTIGYQDLDYYGRWQVTPQYGAVWVPNNVAAGWAPYRYGHWVWIAPWGWTWVDDAPWGFAPFHYGRWVSFGGYWGWAPGPVGFGWRPYYAPALVGWIGGGGWGFGVSFGVGFGIGGGCGWFPLGWGEAYYPWYHGYHGGYVSQNYIRNVNVSNTHITNINNVTNNYYNSNVNNTHYVNRNVAGAVTAAPKSALANGQNIAKVGITVPRSELGRGQVLRSADVTPTKAAMQGGQVARGNAVPPRSAFSRPVVTQSTPPSRSASPAMEAHNVPQAPASLGVRNPNTDAVNPSHNVPRPPERNGAYPTASTSTTSQPAAQQHSNAAYPTAGNSQPAAQHNVPKPPYAGGAAPTNSAAAQHSATPYPTAHENSPARTSQPPAATQHNAPANKTNESKPAKEAPKSNPGMANVSVPQPPSGYSYREAPAASASAYSGNASSSGSTSNYNGGSRSYTPSAPTYQSSRGSYGSSAPTYRSGATYSSAPSYSAAPAYSARANAPAAPHYSAPAAPHYSAPSSSAGHYSSGGGGGGSSHSSSSSSGGHGAGRSR